MSEFRERVVAWNHQQKRIDELQAELKVHHSYIVGYRRAVVELEAKLEHSNRHKKLHLSKYKELEAKVKELEDALSGMTAAADSLSQDVYTLSSEVIE